MSSVQIRWAQPGDETSLLALMKALATFEGYIDLFAVTETDLRRALFQEPSAQSKEPSAQSKEPSAQGKEPSVQVLVAQKGSALVGMLAFYRLPFTYDMKPWWLMKELYVDEQHRSLGIGEQLFNALTDYAKQQGGSRIRWDVLSSNIPAQRFYQRQGARHNDQWQLFDLVI